MMRYHLGHALRLVVNLPNYREQSTITNWTATKTDGSYLIAKSNKIKRYVEK